jgi:hypothetical protein
MAATGGNGSLAPRMRPFVPRRCVGLIEDDPQASRYAFYGDWKSFWLIVLWNYLLRRQWGHQHSSFCPPSLSPCHRYRCVPLLPVFIARRLIPSYPSVVDCCVHWQVFCCQQWHCHRCGRWVVNIATTSPPKTIASS